MFIRGRACEHYHHQTPKPCDNWRIGANLEEEEEEKDIPFFSLQKTLITIRSPPIWWCTKIEFCLYFFLFHPKHTHTNIETDTN